MLNRLLNLSLASALCLSACGQAPQEAPLSSSWKVEPLSSSPTRELTTLQSNTFAGLALDNLQAVFKDENLAPAGTEDGLTLYESNLFVAAVAPMRGSINIRSKQGLVDVAQDGIVNRDSMRAESLELVEALGMSRDQIGTVTQKELMSASKHDDGTVEHEVMAHITFIERAIGQVLVTDSRMVIIHDRQGNFNRAVGWWPEVDRGLSQLTPRHTTETLSQTLTGDLRFQQERLRGTDGLIAPSTIVQRYVLVPTETPEGKVSLKLQLEYIITPDEESSEDQEPSFKPLQLRIDA